MLFCLRCCFLIVIILLATPSFGGTQLMKQDVLNQSKIKKSSFKQIFGDVRKTLPKELRKCSILVTKIKLLKEKSGGVAEDWTVDICQETKIYLVSTFQPKGYYCDVILKQEALAQEKKYWEAAKKHGDENFWRESLLYVDEIEAMSQAGNSSNTEKNSQ